MDIAVLSDIHSNYIALETCVNYAISKNISTFIFLGDFLGDLAYPERTMGIIYELTEKYNCYFVKGNKEEYWLDYSKSGVVWKEKDSTTGSLLYTYNHLKEKDFEFFKSLPLTQIITVENMPRITICHGSPDKR